MIAAGKGTMDQGFGQRFGYTAFPIYIIRIPPKYNDAVAATLAPLNTTPGSETTTYSQTRMTPRWKIPLQGFTSEGRQSATTLMSVKVLHLPPCRVCSARPDVVPAWRF